MLRKENQIRLSADFQALLASIEDRKDIDWLDMVEEMQRNLVQEFGFSGSEENINTGLSFLRSAVSLFPEDEEVRTIPLYVKYNRARNCDVKVGSLAPNVPLCTMSEVPLSLHALVQPGRPLVVVGGSFT